jgi:hypothetical protein
MRQSFPRSAPQAYDGASLRGFAVSVMVNTSFVGLSLMFHSGVGPQGFWALPGRVMGVVGLYTTVLAWSDAIHHMVHYFRGEFRSADEARRAFWGLKFKRASWGEILWGSMWKRATAEELAVTAAPSHIVTVVPVVLIAVFTGVGLMHVRYLLAGPGGMVCLYQRFPDVSRWVGRACDVMNLWRPLS